MSIPKQGYVYPIDHLLYRRIYCIDYFSLPLDRENQENPLIALEWSYEKPYDFFRNTDQFCTQWCCICLLKRSIIVGLICLHKYLEMQVFPKIAHHKSFGMIYQPLTMTKLEWCTIVRKTIIRQGQVTVPACNMFSNWNFLSSALKLILNAYSLVFTIQLFVSLIWSLYRAISRGVLHWPCVELAFQ